MNDDAAVAVNVLDQTDDALWNAACTLEKVARAYCAIKQSGVDRYDNELKDTLASVAKYCAKLADAKTAAI